MQRAWQIAHEFGVTTSGFAAGLELRPDLTAGDILAAVCQLLRQYPKGQGLRNADRKLVDWLKHERARRSGGYGQPRIRRYPPAPHEAFTETGKVKL